MWPRWRAHSSMSFTGVVPGIQTYTDYDAQPDCILIILLCFQIKKRFNGSNCWVLGVNLNSLMSALRYIILTVACFEIHNTHCCMLWDVWYSLLSALRYLVLTVECFEIHRIYCWVLWDIWYSPLSALKYLVLTVEFFKTFGTHCWVLWDIWYSLLSALRYLVLTVECFEILVTHCWVMLTPDNTLWRWRHTAPQSSPSVTASSLLS